LNCLQCASGGWYVIEKQYSARQANSYRFISPLFLLSASPSACCDALGGEKVLAAGNSTRRVSPCLIGAVSAPKLIGTGAGSSLGANFVDVARGKLVGNSFVRGEIADSEPEDSGLPGSGLGGCGITGGPFAKGTGPPAGTKIHCPWVCCGGGLSAA
jgi:hypothetical protein